MTRYDVYERDHSQYVKILKLVTEITLKDLDTKVGSRRGNEI